MLVLCIESSCDETAAAVVRDGRQILSNVVASQVDVHARYGGGVPELAARRHVEALPVVIDQALEQAGADRDLQRLVGVGSARPAGSGPLPAVPSLALGAGDSALPVLDATEAHVTAAIDWAANGKHDLRDIAGAN